jgi:hypothetical protein
VVLSNGSAAGTFSFDYASKLKSLERRECEVSFRVFGGPATIAYMHFPAAQQAPAPTSVPVRLLIPLPKAGPYTATARTGDTRKPAEVKMISAQGQTWAQVDLSLTARTVLTLAP